MQSCVSASFLLPTSSKGELMWSGLITFYTPRILGAQCVETVRICLLTYCLMSRQRVLEMQYVIGDSPEPDHSRENWTYVGRERGNLRVRHVHL